jgi:hypothetical protein
MWTRSSPAFPRGNDKTKCPVSKASVTGQVSELQLLLQRGIGNSCALGINAERGAKAGDAAFLQLRPGTTSVSGDGGVADTAAGSLGL